MPALTLHLLSLTPPITAKKFVKQLRKKFTTKIIVASQPQKVIISPTLLDSDVLLSKPWDLLLLVHQENPKEPIFPGTLASHIQKEYKINVGIPSKLLSTYPQRDAQLKREAKDAPLTGSLETINLEESGQNLEVSGELVHFMEGFMAKVHDGPVTMLNLLYFHYPGGKESYYKYGQAFTPVAAKRGGNAKLVGSVIRSAGSDSRGVRDRPEEDWWNEVSIVHYPSLRHFCDMLAGEDYQEVNRSYRLGALRDTLLLCTTEFEVEGVGEEAKL